MYHNQSLFLVAEAGLDLRQNCWLSFIGSAARFAVPDKIFGLTLTLDFIDHCTALPSLTPPPAAVGSLTQRATLVGLITRRPIEACFITIKKTPSGWMGFLYGCGGRTRTYDLRVMSKRAPRVFVFFLCVSQCFYSVFLLLKNIWNYGIWAF